MKKRSRFALAAALLLFAAAAFLVLGQRSQPRPETLIREAFQQAEEAAKKRDTAGVMRIVSDDYKDASNLNKEKLRTQLTRAYLLTREVKFDVQVRAPQVSLSKEKPDEALVMTTVTVINTDTNEALWGGMPLTVVMRRETGRRWLIFPEDRWRIVSVANLPALPFAGSDSGGMLGL